jgi:hypothetical protein
VHATVKVRLVPTVGAWLVAASEQEGLVGVAAAACCHTSESTTGELAPVALLAVSTYDLPPALCDVALHTVD